MIWELALWKPLRAARQYYVNRNIIITILDGSGELVITQDLSARSELRSLLYAREEMGTNNAHLLVVRYRMNGYVTRGLHRQEQGKSLLPRARVGRRDAFLGRRKSQPTICKKSGILFISNQPFHE